jgi:hypothetical protein
MPLARCLILVRERQPFVNLSDGLEAIELVADILGFSPGEELFLCPELAEGDVHGRQSSTCGHEFLHLWKVGQGGCPGDHARLPRASRTVADGPGPGVLASGTLAACWPAGGAVHIQGDGPDRPGAASGRTLAAGVATGTKCAAVRDRGFPARASRGRSVGGFADVGPVVEDELEERRH